MQRRVTTRFFSGMTRSIVVVPFVVPLPPIAGAAPFRRLRWAIAARAALFFLLFALFAEVAAARGGSAGPAAFDRLAESRIGRKVGRIVPRLGKRVRSWPRSFRAIPGSPRGSLAARMRDVDHQAPTS